MKVLTRSGDQVYLLSVQVALDAAGIPYESAAHAAYRPGIPTEILVADDQYGRAREAMATVTSTSRIEMTPRFKWFARALLTLLVLSFVSVFARMCAGQ